MTENKLKSENKIPEEKNTTIVWPKRRALQVSTRINVRSYKSNEMKDAKTLMFASFIYLPVVQLIYVIDKC